MTTYRVLVVHNRYRSDQPSGEDRVVDQESALLRAAGHDVALFERRSDDIAQMGLAQKVRVPVQVPWNPTAQRELRAAVREHRPDVVHVHNTFPLLSPSVLAACRAESVPVVATLHNYKLVCASGDLFRDGRVCTECVGHSPAPAVLHGCYRDSRAASVPIAVGIVANRRQWRGTDALVCISGSQREVLVRHGYPPDLLRVKHNFAPDPEVRRERPGQHVLFLGRLSPDKGIDLLLRAWERLDGSLGLPLLLAGGGPLAGQVASWATGRDDARALGLQSRDACARLTATAAAVVAPSAWMETFGLVVVEAMAAGVPVVAADHGSFPELVDDGGNGILHRPGDADDLARALRAAVGDAERNAQMGRQARATYESRFSAEVGLANLESLYAAVLAQRSPSR